MKYYIIKRPDGELVTICGELVAAADPIQTTPTASAPAARTNRRGRRKGWTGDCSTFGKRLAAANGCGWAEVLSLICYRNGWTLTQIADAINVHQSTVSKWKTGEWNPNENNGRALMELYAAATLPNMTEGGDANVAT